MHFMILFHNIQGINEVPNFFGDDFKLSYSKWYVMQQNSDKFKLHIYFVFEEQLSPSSTGNKYTKNLIVSIQRKSWLMSK